MDSSEITKFIKKHGSKELNENFMGVYAADQVINFEKKMKKISRHLKMGCCILNTDRYDKPGQHWVSLIQLDPGNCFLFDSFGTVGYKHFFLAEDEDEMSKFLDFKKYLNPSKTTGEKTELMKTVFHSKKYSEALKSGKLNEISDEGKGLCNAYKIMGETSGKDTVNIYHISTPLQDPTNFYCGVFCLYTLSHVYDPHESLGVHDMKKSVETIAHILDQIYSHDKNEEIRYEENTERLRRFVKTYNIKGKFE